MKKHEKLAYLKNADFGLFVKTRQMVFDELSDQQTMFCCCGKLTITRLLSIRYWNLRLNKHETTSNVTGDCTDCKFYEGFGQCYHHGNDLIENCKDYRKE